MDLMTLAGLGVGVGAVYYVLLKGGIASFIYNPEAMILVYGGTFGAILISYPWSILRHAPKAGLWVLFPRKRETEFEVIQTMVGLSNQAKREGVASLQRNIESTGPGFLSDGLGMVVDGIDPEIVRQNLDKELIFTRKRHDEVAGVFRLMGVYAPIFGLLGTLIGVVQVMRHLTEPGKLGTFMAIAVTATFYGIFAANFMFLPIASKLTAASEAEILLKEVMIEGILSIQAGELPIIVERKLQAYLAYRQRTQKGES